MAKSFTNEELKEIYTFALDLGRRAGKILIDGVEKRTGAASARDMGKQEEKMNAVDIVTQTDLGMLCLCSRLRGRGGEEGMRLITC